MKGVFSMRKISKKTDCEGLVGLPPPVLTEIEKMVALLSYYYGENRNADKDLGGYVALIEGEKDFEEIEKSIFRKVGDIIPEWINIIKWQGKEAYTSSLCLLSCDFAVILIMPYSMTPHRFFECKDCIITT